MTTRIFVYGTLKRGYGNNYHIENAKFIGPAISVQPVYKMGTGGFPIVWEDGEGGAFLKGEVYEVNDAELADCDRLEGHPRSYKREERTFNLLPSDSPTYPGDNRPLPLTAWVYLWQGNEQSRRRWRPVEPKDNVLDWERPEWA